MSKPKAYDPQEGYKYQLLVKTPYDKAYEHCDYATDKSDRDHLIQNYSMAYGTGYTFQSIQLPQKYWKKGE